MGTSSPDLGALIERTIDLLTKFSVPLYMDDNGAPSLLGTGFFLRDDPNYYFVSAAHVLDVALEKATYFYTAPSQIRHLSGRLIRSIPKTTRKDDVRDVGVLRLDQGPYPPFPQVDKFALDISYLKPLYRPRDTKQYVLVGFPVTKSKTNRPERTVRVQPVAYRDTSIPEEDYSAHGLSPDSHVLIRLDLRRGYTPDGKRINIPKPQGMSGSPVMVLMDDDPDGSRTFPVVAVAIEYRRKQKILVASDVKYVLEAVAHAA